MKKIKESKYFISLYIFFVFLLLLFFVARHADLNNKNKENLAHAILPVERRNTIFDSAKLEAESAIVLSSKDGVLYQKKTYKPMPLASITKVFLAYLSIKYLDENEFIEITKEDTETEGYSFLDEGDRWRISELIKYMLFVSSNDAASALARTLEDKLGSDIVAILNKEAESLGLSSAIFIEPSGLDYSLREAGAYMSAKDLAHFVLHNIDFVLPTFEYGSKTEHIFYAQNKQIKAKNTNQFIDKIFGSEFSKTGFTDLAGGNLVISFLMEPDNRIIIAVLHSSKEGRFYDVLELYNLVLKYYSS